VTEAMRIHYHAGIIYRDGITSRITGDVAQSRQLLGVSPACNM